MCLQFDILQCLLSFKPLLCTLIGERKFLCCHGISLLTLNYQRETSVAVFIV